MAVIFQQWQPVRGRWRLEAGGGFPSNGGEGVPMAVGGGYFRCHTTGQKKPPTFYSRWSFVKSLLIWKVALASQNQFCGDFTRDTMGENLQTKVGSQITLGNSYQILPRFFLMFSAIVDEAWFQLSIPLQRCIRLPFQTQRLR